MAIEQITVPDLGDAGEVEVIELLVAVGDSVEENDSLLVLESDKAAMEIPAPLSGVVKSIDINLGDQVSTGSPIMTLETAGADTTEEPVTQPQTQPEAGAEAAAEPEAPAQEADEPQAVAGQTESVSVVVNVPDLGTDDEVDVIELHVKAGDSISVDDPLITLESDKAAMEVPATEAGEVEELLLNVGDKVKTGSAILRLKSSGSVATPKPAESAADSGEEAPKSAAAETPATKAEPASAVASAETKPAIPSSAPAVSSGKVYAGPAVRKLARELGVDLAQVPGTGARGRIIKEDVHEFVKARINSPAGSSGVAISAVPDIDFSQFGEIERVDRSKLHKVTAINMQRNWSSIPHVAQFNEADVTELEAFRAELKPEAERRGTKLTFLPFLLKACANALQTYPQFNVSLHSSGEYLIQKKYIHIGMAVATPAGLVVPVIRDVDKKSIWELAEEVLALSAKARDRKLTMEEMQGACFTISSLGAIGGTGFIPIINAPEVAILGVAKTDIKPVYIDGEFKPRKMLPLTLSYDHKALNGVDGGQFADHLVKVLGDIRHLVL